MSVAMSHLPDPPDGEGGPECERCDDVAPSGREVDPESLEGSALNLDEPAWVCTDCLGRLDRVLSGWNR